MAANEALAEKLRLVSGAPMRELPSPCVSVCRMDASSGLCEGCYRTLDEIAAWSGLDEEAKREVWRRIGRRALSAGAVSGEG